MHVFNQQECWEIVRYRESVLGQILVMPGTLEYMEVQAGLALPDTWQKQMHSESDKRFWISEPASGGLLKQVDENRFNEYCYDGELSIRTEEVMDLHGVLECRGTESGQLLLI